MRLFRRRDKEPKPEPEPKQRFYESPTMQCPNCQRYFTVPIPTGEWITPRDITCPNCEVVHHIELKVKAER